MKEIATKILKDSKLITVLNKNVFDTLLIILVFTLIVWYAQYHWKRKKLYAFAAKRNGPFALPFIGNALHFAGSNHDILSNALKIANSYDSPVRVWLGQKLFFAISKPHQLEVIMNSPNALEKDELYKHAEAIGGTGLFTASVPKWKRHRKIIMPTFNQKILDDFVEVFCEESQILVKQLEKVVGKGTFNVFHYVSRCTLDIICETAMGVTVDAQTTDSDYVKWANRAMEIMFTRMFVIWYHYDFIFNLTSLAKEYADVAKKLHDFTGAVVKERRMAYQQKMKESKERPEALFEEEPKTRKTFLQQLIELSEAGANFTDEELREEVDTFMIAGSDTTASMNSFVFIMLGMFSEIQDKVYEEVMDVLGSDRPVECKDLIKFVYLERVIKETMRLFPVGPLLVRAITEDIELDNAVIPAGSSVVMFIMALHLDPEIWPNPKKFNPDRFLPEEVAKRHPYSWLPFSGGPRNCVGPKYAMMAMKALIATVIRKYRFSTEYKTIDDIKLKADLMLKPVDGYKLAVELRE
ncbi:hypothetical protein ILUMI_21097 [Ignelater luminosus]|uniref:Cytochrome P450 n=1 Tax=Ignelater luminosus TaxID=2038154 RepID=A0A8K0CF89_IGNLU|nr:hypothetical protein ILUMI_21097 [Ignelater luminosus]